MIECNGFGKKIQKWWRGKEVNSKACHRLASKLKAIKSATKEWGKEEQRKSMDMQGLFHDMQL